MNELAHYSLKVILTAVFGVMLFAASSQVSAQNYGAGTYGSCQYGNCSISVSSSGSVDLSVTPTITGACTVASDTVGVSTSSSMGYTLQLSSTSSETRLLSGENALAATGGSVGAPESITMNSWGFRVDGGAFGDGPTTAVSSGPALAALFAGVPSNVAPATIAAPSSFRSAPDNTTVWYAACATSAQLAGVYSGSVTYTALVNN